jgi:hypothetical protein
MLKQIYHLAVPLRFRASARATINLLREHGLYKSLSSGPVSPKGEALPWITYPAITYLLSFDLTGKDVFEFGCGASTRFWSRVAKSVTSVESDKGWYEKVRSELPKNASLNYASDESPANYVQPLLSSGRKYDIIVIDGSHRPHCATVCQPFLANGGIIIHDNTDWYQTTRGILLGYDLIPVDFFGFIPSSAHTGITSFYLTREFSWKPAPMPPWIPGGLIQNHENSAAVAPGIMRF